MDLNRKAFRSLVILFTIAITIDSGVVLTHAYGQFPQIPNLKPQKVTNIGLVMPTFTDAAYNHAFYLFYSKHQVWNPVGGFSQPIHNDLSLLTGKIIAAGATTRTAPAVFLFNHLKRLVSNSNVQLLTDGDIDGGIASEYDILIIFQQEYVTEQEYNNFKNFVANGGTLICMDGNIFYAQVSFNQAAQTVTLVKGHGWAFDGRGTAHRLGTYNKVIERWANETSQWLGSNFDQELFGETSNGTLIYRHIVFKVNPFGYNAGEEQEITNSLDKIILNYHAIIPNYSREPVIATYEKGYGKGKVIVFGLYTDHILSNPKYQQFFDDLFLSGVLKKGILIFETTITP